MHKNQLNEGAIFADFVILKAQLLR